MNAELLLAHYDRIADAPDAVPRLRRFILDLAVRGKLVAQDPNDEPASELLKRIQPKKVKLGRSVGTPEETEAFAAAIRDEIPFPIPVNWRWSQIAGDWFHQSPQYPPTTWTGLIRADAINLSGVWGRERT